MSRRFKSCFCLATLAILALPMTASCQIDVPPVFFTGPLSHPRYDLHWRPSDAAFYPLDSFCRHGNGIVQRILIAGSCNWRCQGYVAWLGPNIPSPFAAVALDQFLGDMPFGALSASIDAQTTLFCTGPGLCLHWYPWEGVNFSVRLDPLQGGRSQNWGSMIK